MYFVKAHSTRIHSLWMVNLPNARNCCLYIFCLCCSYEWVQATKFNELLEETSKNKIIVGDSAFHHMMKKTFLMQACHTMRLWDIIKVILGMILLQLCKKDCTNFWLLMLWHGLGVRCAYCICSLCGIDFRWI